MCILLFGCTSIAVCKRRFYALLHFPATCVRTLRGCQTRKLRLARHALAARDSIVRKCCTCPAAADRHASARACLSRGAISRCFDSRSSRRGGGAPFRSRGSSLFERGILDVVLV